MAVFKKRPTGRSCINAPIVRLKANERMQVVCLNDDLTGADIHYTFRTEPCVREHGDCPLCNEGKAYRWEGYFLGWSPSTNVTAIYAVSEANAATFESFHEREGSLRGATITMSRGARSNERVKVGIMKGALSLAALPSDQPIDKILNAIWHGRKKHVPIYHHEEEQDANPFGASSGAANHSPDPDADALREAQARAHERLVYGDGNEGQGGPRHIGQLNGRH